MTRPPHRWEEGKEPGSLDLAARPEWLVKRKRRRARQRAEPLPTVIRDGKWHKTMVSAAGTLRRRGFSAEAATAALVAENGKYEGTPPPDSDTEIADLVADVYERYDAQEEIELERVPDGPPQALVDVVETFQKWLYLPDPGALYTALAAIVANRLPGDPAWLLLVGPSSSGKTEILVALGGLPEVEPAATLSEAALLSGVPRKEVAVGASGGLLRKIGEYGVLTLKDFGSVLSQRSEVRAGTLAALRELYDGTWDRPLGVDGGKTLHWEGKLGFVAGVTTVVDRHHAVMDALGSRFAMYRITVGDRDEQGRRSLKHLRQARAMRGALRDAVSGFFTGLELPDADEHALSLTDVERIVHLASFATLARSPIERDPYASREIEFIPDPEGPARFTVMLAAFLEAFRLLGLDHETAWTLTEKVAFDSMPAQRRRVLEHLAESEKTTAKEAATVLGLPTTSARRTLQDLAAHGLLTRESGGDGKADIWRLAVAIPHGYAETTVPEMTGTPVSNNTDSAKTDISGKVGEEA